MRIGKRTLGSLTCLLFINGMWILPATSQGWRDQSPANGAAKMDTIAEVYGLTEDWVKDFFKRPDSYIQEHFGIPACGDNPNCANIANDVLRSKRKSWSGSKDKGKMLVFLTYIIGSSIMHEKGNLKWTVIYNNGFLDTISIGDDYQIMRIFDKIANFDTEYFILNDEGFDILTWKRLLRFEEVAGNRPVPGARIDVIK